jgi:hypothetical protein
LRSGRPRPRSEHWRDIEQELARQIRTGRFSDYDGLFRFASDVEKAAI